MRPRQQPRHSRLFAVATGLFVLTLAAFWTYLGLNGGTRGGVGSVPAIVQTHNVEVTRLVVVVVTATETPWPQTGPMPTAPPYVPPTSTPDASCAYGLREGCWFVTPAAAPTSDRLPRPPR